VLSVPGSSFSPPSMVPSENLTFLFGALGLHRPLEVPSPSNRLGRLWTPLDSCFLLSTLAFPVPSHISKADERSSPEPIHSQNREYSHCPFDKGSIRVWSLCRMAFSSPLSLHYRIPLPLDKWRPVSTTGQRFNAPLVASGSCHGSEFLFDFQALLVDYLPFIRYPLDSSTAAFARWVYFFRFLA